MAKLALVSYLERKKVISVPSASNGSDLKNLEEGFRKEFKFNSTAHYVSFQRFDEDWGEFVEIDEDYILLKKEKLKAMVYPIEKVSCEVFSKLNVVGDS